MAVLDLFLASYRSNQSAGGSRQRFRGRPAHPLAVLARRVAAGVLLFAGLLLAPATTQAQTESGWRIDTIAGTGKPGHGGDGGRAIEARLSFPSGVAVDNAGNVYIADFFSHRIRGVDTTGTITSIAGSGKPSFGGDGGQAIEAQLSFPSGVAVDNAGNVYITDTGNSRVRRIDTTGTITTIAGTGEHAYGEDVGLAVETPLANPKGVAVDNAGNLYIAGYHNFRKRRVDAAGTIGWVAGTGEPYDGPADEERLSRDRGIAVDNAGNIYIANIDNNYVRRVDATGTVSVIAGTREPGYGGDGGPAAEAQLNFPSSVAVDNAGNLYIADTGNHRIRRIDTTGTITTIGGTGEPGFGGDGGPATEAQLASPVAVAVDGSGNLYVSDLGNYRIRVLTQSIDVGGARAPLLEGMGGLVPLRSAVPKRKLMVQHSQTTRKLLVVVPEGGTVRMVSNNFVCGAGETCEVPIDEEFHEVFVPQPKAGYRFNSWKQSSEHFCGGLTVNCTIAIDGADSFTHLEPLFEREVASTGYSGIRKLDYRDMAVDGLFFNQVHADFDNDGVLDLFRVAGAADGRSTERQHVEMWLGNGDGAYRWNDDMLVDSTVGGVNPRKTVVADFNGDDRADVIVADHGYDAEPFPGAPLLLYLSTADGRLEKAKGLEHIIGFHHSVAAGDIDGDGDTDAFVTDFLPAFLINDGKGNMITTRAYLPKRLLLDHAGYYTSELIDVDRDGNLDLLVAGHEFGDAPSLILWGNTEPGFANSTASTLPAVTNFGIVVDIDVGDFDGDGINDVLLNRAGSEPGRGFYDGIYLQLLKGQEDRRTFSDITDSSIDNETLLDTYGNDWGWFVWLIVQDWDFDGDLDILVDNHAANEQGLVLINQGRALFSTLVVQLGEPSPTVPHAPENLKAVGRDGEAVLNWSAPGGAAITDYEYRIDRRGDWISIGSTDTTHTVAGLVNGTTYVFQVRAVSRVGRSEPSLAAEGTAVSPAVLDFAHFANGAGLISEVVLVNVAPHPIQPTLYFYDQEGHLVDPESLVDVGDDLEIIEDGGLTVRTEMEPLGELTISTHGRGDLVSGSVKVNSYGSVGGVLRFDLPGIGVAGVQTSPSLRDAIFPVRRQKDGINTGMAIHNREEKSVVVNCRLMKEGAVLEEEEIPLAANGQVARFIDEVFPATDTSDFVGSVRCTAPGEGQFTGMALELDSGNGIFTTLPVVSVSQDGETTLDFAHFANGDSIVSEMVFISLETQPGGPSAHPLLYYYDQEGHLIDPESLVDVMGDLEVTEEGSLTVRTEMEPLGELTISTHGRGPLVSGSVQVLSDGPIGGVLRFDLPGVGVAGVGASQPLRDAIFPVRRQEGGIDTGMALRNLGESELVLTCRLMKYGAVLEEEEIPLAANGQVARFIGEVFTGTDTSDFVGSVRCTAPGEEMFTGLVLELDVGNRIFTTLPVVPVEERMSQE